MKKLVSILFLALALSATAAPPPILRNYWSTNVTGPFERQSFGLRIPRVEQKLRNHQVGWITVFGDDAFLQFDPLVARFQRHGIRLNGYGNGITGNVTGNHAMQAGDSTVDTTVTEGNSGGFLFPVSYFRMQNGSVVSNWSQTTGRVGWDMNQVTVRGWKRSGLGSMAVQTNTGWNKSSGWGTLFTIDCNAGADYTPFLTNRWVGYTLTNGAVRVVATGSNYLFSATGYKTNDDAGWVFERWTGGNIGIENTAESSYWSNSFRVFLGNSDWLAISDVTDSASYGATNLWRSMQINDLDYDVTLTTAMWNSNNATAYNTYYKDVQSLRGKVPFGVYDSGRMTYPTNASKYAEWFGDETHGTVMAADILMQDFLEETVSQAKLIAYGYPRRDTNYLFFGPTSFRGSGGGSLTLAPVTSSWGVQYGLFGVLCPISSTFQSLNVVIDSTMFPYKDCNIFQRFLCLTTNAATASASPRLVAHTIAIPGFVNNGDSGSASVAGNFSVGASGSTNFTYSSWYNITPTNNAARSADWAGYLSTGTDSTAATTSFFILGVQLRIEPKIPYY